jgi:hypothetical protein
MKLFFKILLVLVFLFLYATSASAQTWSVCSDGTAISRCETYDCPQGDTNKDGNCNLNDSSGRLADARNDAFCNNPISGCGVVLYYKQGVAASCAVHVKENNKNCDLYSVADVSFTPTPTSRPNATSTPFVTMTPTPTPTLLATASATVTPTASAAATTKGGQSLPDTGPSLWISLGFMAIGAIGVLLYTAKPKTTR